MWWWDTTSNGEILEKSSFQKQSLRASTEYANINMQMGYIFIFRNTSYNLLLCLFVYGMKCQAFKIFMVMLVLVQPFDLSYLYLLNEIPC